jgi:putative transposase
MFLKNHREVTAAMDFFSVPIATFCVLYCFFVISHGRSKILHFNATEHPTSTWVAQQIREAFPKDAAPRYLILDRDSKYNEEATEILKNLGSHLIRTAYRSPWPNAIAERWISSCRRELLDHVIVLNENHLRRLIRDYIRYYYEDRIHDALDKDTPERRAIEPRGVTESEVVAVPRLAGLHHHYTWHKAA